MNTTSWTHSIFLISILFISVRCSSDINEPDRSDPGTAISLNASETYQTIAGFGGANQMWGNTFPTDGDIAKAYGTDENELGFTIFRVRIASNPDEWSSFVDVALEAQSYGATIIASPWSPPANLKSNDNDIGGYLLEENYGAYAQHINDFLELMTSNGVNIYAISIQNEPDIEVGYESCDWTATAIRDFVRDYGDLINSRVMASESFNFNKTYTDVILDDQEAAANLDIVAGHIYGGGLERYPEAEASNKEIWMTEYLMNLNTGNENAPVWSTYSEEEIWNETMNMLGTLHESMANNWNAYIWWYLKRYYSFIGDGTEGTTDGEILKRGYAFSHYSRFIRPGFQRIRVNGASNTNLDITAYEGNNQKVAVIVNSSTSSTKINLSIEGVELASAVSYRTTVQHNRVEVALTIENGMASTTIPPRSVTTIILE